MRIETLLIIPAILVFCSGCNKLKSEIKIEELTQPELQKTEQINIVCTTGFEEDKVVLKVGNHLIFDELISSEESSGMATIIESSPHIDGDHFSLEINGGQFEGELNRGYDGLMILIEDNWVVFRYTNEPLMFD